MLSGGSAPCHRATEEAQHGRKLNPEASAVKSFEGMEGKHPNKRRRRNWNGWTERTIAAHNQLLEKHPPKEFYSLKFPVGAAPKQQHLRSVMAKLNKALMDACRRYGYQGAWCLFYENGRNTGLHFHAWFAELPGESFEQATRRFWLKLTRQTNNSSRVFDASGPSRVSSRVESYLGKFHKGAFVTKAPQTFTVHRADRFKPFSFHQGEKKKVSSGPSPQPVQPTEVTLRSASGSDFAGGEVTFSNGTNPCKHKASSYDEETGAATGVEHIHLEEQGSRQDWTGREGGLKSLLPEREAAHVMVTIGVRIVCNHGANELIPPDDHRTNLHFHLLESHGYTCCSPPWKDPLRPSAVLEVLFLIPVGRVVAFEKLAGSYKHARIFRPSDAASYLVSSTNPTHHYP